jgi:hypothetical protein
MTAFPALVPSSRTFTPGDRAHALLRSMGGRSTQVRHSNVVTGQQLQLLFKALPEASMLAVQLHYINRRGQFATFSLPSAIWSGTTDQTISGYSWHYISMPTVTEPTCGRFDVSITLELVAEYAPPATTGDAFVRISVGRVTVTSLAPTVFGSPVAQLPAATIAITPFVPVIFAGTAATVAVPAAAITVEALMIDFNVVALPAVDVTVAGLAPIQNNVPIPAAEVTIEALAPTLSP